MTFVSIGGRSSWFRNLLSEHHNPESQGDYVLQISIDDVKSDVMNEILNFIYTNRCLISLKNASNLLVVAKRFGLEKLVRQIGDFLLFRLTTENALDLFVSAHESGSEALKAACIRLINRNAEKIKRTEKWKKFKTQYVDLVPELYENRVERRPVPQQPFLPDVFNHPIIVPESLHTLSQMYENPIKQRAPSPAPHILPQPKKYHKTVTHALPYQTTQTYHTHEPIIKETTGAFHQRNGTPLSNMYGREDTPKKHSNNNTARRPAPVVPPVPRAAAYPTVKPQPYIDNSRRPVNAYGKTGPPPPVNNQKQKPTMNQVRVRSPPSAPTMIHRNVSPTQYVDIRRSPAYSDTSPDENLRLGRVISVETVE